MLKGTSLMITIRPAILSFVTLLSLTANAQAAPYSQTTPGSAAGQAQPMPQFSSYGSVQQIRRFTGEQDFMYQSQELKAPVAASYLPQCGSDSKYIGGLSYPRLKGRQCFVMRYLARETNAVLMQRYKDSLTQNGWVINQSQSNDKQLAALRKDNGLYLTLSVNPCSKQGYHSSFEIKCLSAASVPNSMIQSKS